jgi:ribosomal-protein-alanine N-acetyltransferase
MTPAVDVRLAVERDAGEIAAMSRELIEYGLPWSWTPSRVRRAIQAADTNVVVVRGQNELSAFGIMEYWDEDAHLVLFAVRATRQRQGVGSRVLRWLEDSAHVAGAKRIRVEARGENVSGRCFYNEHGYHEVAIKARNYSGIADGILMEKWLRANGGGDA